MNTSPSFLSVAAPATLALWLLAAAVPRASGQQFSGVSPVANPAVPSAAGTPAAVTDAAADVENPPPPEKADPNAPTETEVLATNGAEFASKERIAVFNGDVRVNDPRFQLACDKLTVFLAKSATGDGGKDPAPAPVGTPTPTNGAAEPKDRSGGIDHAKAEGHVIIIQKRAAVKPGEEPKISIGRAAEADFDNKTGDMVLRGWPSVEQNGSTHVSLAQSVVMTLHKDNSMTTVGPTRTVIKQQHKEEPGGSPGAGQGPQGTPGGKKRARPEGASQG